jgi:tRNA A-37 threonylcarbamoyl transferase component Bud32
MATIIKLPGNAGPVNAGEARVIEKLAAGLPESYALISNITIPFERDNPEEYDIIIVGPDGVFVLEVKTLAGNVDIQEQVMLVDGEQRANPWNSSRIKAQKLAGKIAKSLGNEPKVWVEHLVVLSRAPRTLKVTEAFANRIIVGANPLLPLLKSPSPLIHPKGHGLHRDRRDSIVAAITGGAALRPSRRTFNDYHALRRVHQVGGVGGFEYWEAEHRLHGGLRLLQVFPATSNDDDTVNVKRIEARRRIEVAEVIGPSADIIAPREHFQTAEGEYVLVWPSVDSPSLDSFLQERATSDADSALPRLDDRSARALLEGFARAFADLHRAGYVFGPLDANAFVVRPNGRGAVVLQYPVPTKSHEHRPDLDQLLQVAKKISAECDIDKTWVLGKLIEKFETALKSGLRAELPSAGWLAAGCQVGDRLVSSREDLADHFEKLTEVASHAYGKTFRAKQRGLKREVAIRVERGRPGQNWAEREATMLSRREAVACQGVVEPIVSGSVAEGFFIATEWLDGVPLTALLDAGAFRQPSDAIGATLQLLEILVKIHPNLRGLDEIIGSSKEIGPDQLERVESIRASGFAHNHIEPSNVIWTEDRGPVLIDFARAAEMGREIPVRLSPFWPTDVPRSQSNPLADIYAVGLIMLVMLTGSLNPHDGGDTIDARVSAISKIDVALANIVAKATAAREADRYRTASQMVDALQALRVGNVRPLKLQGAAELMHEIEAMVAEGRLDDAIAICKQRGWTETVLQIERKRNMLRSEGQELAAIDDVRVTYLGSRDVGPGTTGSNKSYESGLAHVYLATLAEGGVLEFHTVTAQPFDDDGGPLPYEETWVQGDLEHGLPEHMQMLAERRRLVVIPLTSDGQPVRDKDFEKGKGNAKRKRPEIGEGRYCQIRQLQLASAEKTGSHWEATTRKVTTAQLSAGAGGIDIGALLKRFGADGFGTREDLIGDKSRLRGDLCATFGKQSIHVPALVFVVSRILPLKNKVLALSGEDD